MIRVTFVKSHTEKDGHANVVVIAGTEGDMVSSTMFIRGEDPNAVPTVGLAIRTKGFRTGFFNPSLEDVTVDEVPLDSVEINSW